MKKIGIIGFGRFGELLASLTANKFETYIIESNEARAHRAASLGFAVISIEDATALDFIFLAVPISLLEPTISALAPHVNENHVIIDLCSVKMYPAMLMKKYLAKSQLLCSHPMFGPDSAKKGLQGLQVALCPLTIEEDNLGLIKEFWSSYGCEIVITTPDQHDKDVVFSQAFTYTIAKIILNAGLPPVKLQTRSFQAITEVAALSANDTDQLFHDMLFYNPYFAQMKLQLEEAIVQTNTVLDTIQVDQSSAKLFEP